MDVPTTPFELEREHRAFLKIVRAVCEYDKDASALLERWRRRLGGATAHETIGKALERVERVGPKCVANNASFLSSAVWTFVDNERAPDHLRVPRAEVEKWAADDEFRAAPEDAEKVRYVLKNAWRDWSEEGKCERDPVYDEIFEALEERLGAIDASVGSPDGEAPRVLVPGCGLGRLVYELAKRGYDAQGNEYSYYMLLFSSFMLNATSRREEFEIHPWLHVRSNHRAAGDQWRGAHIPDEVPGDAKLPPGACMSMAAGDFSAVYNCANERGMWDAVVTCFFIDTGHNVVEYLECIANCLRSGGVWVNFGPLLYHWEDYESEQSVELSLEEVIEAAKTFGLDIERSETKMVDYTSDPRSMHRTTYSCEFIVATKR
ncbi:N2227-like [Ostreococcus tauri]|uniref:carnosine N-methyltransferase n=1 Tax=Ostreococcus tauri TaxID=70448 RepID=A0A090N3E3_OSTTA|nr:N2227-like [Ostreococcus tauri]OUS47989.1 N2227-like protein-domain-containing protein [Ostreococcus tauri]CEF97968.1 N2227-like [Ostreococcus tauri]|eukprot:XP_022838998.1 N2227-like [Ostreococcus tauri]